MGYDYENLATLSILTILTLVYLYLLLSPSQPRLPTRPVNFVIKPDSLENYKLFISGSSSSGSGSEYDKLSEWMYDDGRYNSSSGELSEFGAKGQQDDFFMDTYNEKGGSSSLHDDDGNEVIIPSTDVICVKDAWMTIRSEMNYKYLWMHGSEQMWMAASATMDTPMHRKTFFITPVQNDCTAGQNWVVMREGDSEHFIQMISPNHTAHLQKVQNDNMSDPSLAHITTSIFSSEMWTIKLGEASQEEAFADPSYHFLLEKDGFLLNKEAMAFINIIPESDYPARGHSGGWNRNKPAKREFGAAMHFQIINSTVVEQAIEKERQEEAEAADMDEQLVKQIQAFKNPYNEKRVISFGLYGSKPKYTIGAIRNIELSKVYFPGWVCRFYVTSDVPDDILEKMKSLGAEIRDIPAGMGYTSGMFWRFMVASDPTIDRYIIRDSDSRLNARDRMAVEEWIQSKQKVHIMRDHVNHCIVMNGGMWGGVKGAIHSMEEKINAWENRDEYMADLHFLDKYIWPDIKEHQLSHDSYCCDRYPHTKPFPTKRYMNYQHVGQVFDDLDRARLTDIDGFIRGVPIPNKCRKQSDWIYG